MSSAIKVQAKEKLGLSHDMKSVSFVKMNNDVPFIVKRRESDADLISSIMYGCESCVNANFKPVVKLYNRGLK